MTEGRNHAEMIPHVILETARHAVESRPVATVAKVKGVDDDNDRATVELLGDAESSSSNVPITVPYSDRSRGDIVPVEPGSKVIVLFLDHGVESLLDGDDTPGTGQDIEDAIILPAFFNSNQDDHADHGDCDRVFDHPSGSTIKWGCEGQITIEHQNGSTIELGGNPEPDAGPMPDSFKAEEENAPADERHPAASAVVDNTAFPPETPGESYERFRHPDGSELTLSSKGVSVAGGQPLHAGRPNDGDRRELSGPHQHFHVIHHANGEKSLAGPPLSFREFLAWMTDTERQGELRNADQYGDARAFAENYLTWLEAEVGHGLDPTDASMWPLEEPMPTADERDSFDTGEQP